MAGNLVLQGMVTEEELMKLMQLKKSELHYLRAEKGMPFVRLNNRKRVYLEEDLMAWFKKNRVVQDETGE